VRAFHDHERGDHVDEVGILGPVNPLIGKRDEIDPGLNDAEEPRMSRQDLLAAEPIQRFDQEVRPAFDRTRLDGGQKLTQGSVPDVCALEC
jgi:hypothetical protein